MSPSGSNVPHLYEEFRWPPTAFKVMPPASGERWQGTVGDAVNELGHVVVNGYQQTGEDAPWDETPWHPARIVASVIRATMGGTPRFGDLTELTRFTKSLFLGTATAADVDAIGEIARRHSIDQQDAYLWIDPRTLGATNPAFSQETATRLMERSRQKLFMIALGNGGFTAGVLTALEYQRLTGRDLPVYPIRFSAHKEHDYKPRITIEEVLHITAETEDGTIVVFDEDTTSGRTIGEAILHFTSVLPNRHYVGLANSDKRYRSEGDLLRQQGEWWERYPGYR